MKTLEHGKEAIRQGHSTNVTENKGAIFFLPKDPRMIRKSRSCGRIAG
jgi:hypothetical protein